VLAQCAALAVARHFGVKASSGILEVRSDE